MTYTSYVDLHLQFPRPEKPINWTYADCPKMVQPAPAPLPVTASPIELPFGQVKIVFNDSPCPKA